GSGDEQREKNHEKDDRARGGRFQRPERLQRYRAAHHELAPSQPLRHRGRAIFPACRHPLDGCYPSEVAQGDPRRRDGFERDIRREYPTEVLEMTRDEIRNLVEAWARAVAACDVSALERLVDPALREGVVGRTRAVHAAFQDVDVAPVQVVIDGDAVAWRW